MYFRHKRTPTGQVLQLVESYRNAEGRPRHRVVISLGNAPIPKENWTIIAKAVERRLYAQQELFEWNYSRSVQGWIDKIIRRIDLQGRWCPLRKYKESSEPSKASDEFEEEGIEGVLISQVNHGDTAILGPLLAGYHVWKQLKMDECLNGLGFNKFQQKAATVSVLNRLVAPLSEHALMEWLGDTALPELLGEDVLHGGKDRFYRVSDKLLSKKRSIESHVRSQQRRFFSLKRTVFLYDLTNTYFEGKAERNAKAKKGKSKHKRDDCPQIVVGMVFDEHGFELGHQIFEGNRNDSTTLIEMVNKLQEVVREEANLFCVDKPMIIVDAGVATKNNLKLLRDSGFHYLVNDSRHGRKAYREEFLKKEGFKLIKGRGNKTPIRVRMIKDLPDRNRDKDNKDEADRLVLCKSEGRLKKEKAIRSKVEDRFLETLERLAKRVGKGQLKQKSKIERAIGRILAKNTRVARFYNVEVEERKKESDSSTEYRVVWSRDDEKYQADGELLGCYVLRTDKSELSATEIWELYMTLTKAEDGFRSLKSDLGLRPNYHHKEDRVDAHVFITVLAYNLLQHILYTLKTQGDLRSWETIKRILSTHCYTTIILPTKKKDVHRIRKAGIPEASQKSIYDALGVEWKNLPVINEHGA